MDQITYEERRRIAELVAEGAPRWKLHLEINRSRHAIRRAVIALHRPARREPKRSPLRLSPTEPLSWPRQHLLRATAAALVFAPVLVALIPAVVALALAGFPPHSRDVWPRRPVRPDYHHS